MLYSETTIIKCTPMNAVYYKNLGYECIPGENFECKIKDLHKLNAIKIIAKCNVCGKDHYVWSNDYCTDSVDGIWSCTKCEPRSRKSYSANEYERIENTDKKISSWADVMIISTNVAHYSRLGYACKVRQFTRIRIEDLLHSCKSVVQCKCKCGKYYTIEYATTMHKKHKGSCTECANEIFNLKCEDISNDSTKHYSSWTESRMSTTNLSRYRKLGYVAGLNEVIQIKIEDVPLTSISPVMVRCISCNETYIMEVRDRRGNRPCPHCSMYQQHTLS